MPSKLLGLGLLPEPRLAGEYQLDGGVGKVLRRGRNCSLRHPGSHHQRVMVAGWPHDAGVHRAADQEKLVKDCGVPRLGRKRAITVPRAQV